MKLNKIFCLFASIGLVGCQAPLEKQNNVNHNMMEKIALGEISLIAPASWIGKDEGLFYEQHYPDFWSKIKHQYSDAYRFLSNTDEQRFEYFAQSLSETNSTAIWTLRGGYGSARIIPFLSRMPKPSVHKWLIGFSDITALHLFVSQNWGWKSIHGAVAKEITDNKSDPLNFQYLDDILSGSTDTLTYSGLKLLNEKRSPLISGKLTGGNATLISSSIGTSWQINAQNKIIIIEDYGDSYRFDRVLQQLKHANILKGALAIIIGDITIQEEDLELIITDFIKDLNVPIFKCDLFGHGVKNYPWIYNSNAIIEANDLGSYQLTFETK